MRIDSLLKELYSHQQGQIKLDLSRMERLSKMLDHPERKIRAIHVAGSNGKGSTCAFLFSILREAGYSVGFYSSPHLRHFNERIRMDDQYIADKDIVRLYAQVKRHLAGDETFFEITTMMAFLYFAEKNPDFVLLEVGLGGRLDATNIATPLLSVITRIDLEHTDILGTTLQSIAREKAGIVKKNVPVATSAKDGAFLVIKRRARKKNAPLSASLRWKKTAQGLSINGHAGLILGLKGDHQRENAALALTAIKVLEKKRLISIPKGAVVGGLRKARWPGRMEYLSKNILMDCAHNATGMGFLEKEMQKIRKDKIIVMGTLRDKDISAMMKIACRNAKLIVLTTPNSERAAMPEELAKFATTPCLIVPDPMDALKEAKRMAKKGDLIVLTGSIYLMGEYLDPL